MHVVLSRHGHSQVEAFAWSGQSMCVVRSRHACGQVRACTPFDSGMRVARSNKKAWTFTDPECTLDIPHKERGLSVHDAEGSGDGLRVSAAQYSRAVARRANMQAYADK